MKNGMCPEKSQKTVTLKEAADWGKAELEKNGVEEASLDAWYLLEHVTGMSRAAYYAYPETGMTAKQEREYRDLIQRRGRHIPLQHLTGTQEFMGLEFQVNEHVLIPRQDTETLVEYALGHLKKGKLPGKEGKVKILDLCTGSGCILLSVLTFAREDLKKRNLPGTVEGVGADISEDALCVAEKNAKRLYPGAEFVKSDLFKSISGRYGMILSNPPYIPTEEIKSLQEEVRLHDPFIALDGKEDGLYFYRKIISDAPDFLEHGGILAFEIGYDQAEEVSRLFKSAGYTEITVKKDLAGLDRVVSGVLQ